MFSRCIPASGPLIDRVSSDGTLYFWHSVPIRVPSPTVDLRIFQRSIGIYERITRTAGGICRHGNIISIETTISAVWVVLCAKDVG